MLPHTPEHEEPHTANLSSRINWLRAAVLGANDGIVSVAALVVGVAGATSDPRAILTAGIAGTIAGALSMAAGEYVSVAAERDTEQALLAKERRELDTEPEAELEELVGLYVTKGLSRLTAATVARELTANDAFSAHVETELKLDPGKLASPTQAAFASALSFFSGAVIPIAVIVVAPPAIEIPATFVAALLALMATGWLGARAGGAGRLQATLRVAAGGALAMASTYLIGYLFGVSGI